MRVGLVAFVCVALAPALASAQPSICGPGQLVVDAVGHCCSPGQTWDAAAGTCTWASAPTPANPAGTEPSTRPAKVLSIDLRSYPIAMSFSRLRSGVASDWMPPFYVGLGLGGWFGDRYYLGGMSDIAEVGSLQDNGRNTWRLRGGAEGRYVFAGGTGSVCNEDTFDCRDVSLRHWVGLGSGVEAGDFGIFGAWADLSYGLDWLMDRWDIGIITTLGVGRDNVPLDAGASYEHVTASFALHFAYNLF